MYTTAFIVAIILIAFLLVIDNNNDSGIQCARSIVDRHYINEWDGNPSDAVFAWLRIQRRLIDHNPDPKLLQAVEERIRITKQSLRSGRSVRQPNGRIVHYTYN